MYCYEHNLGSQYENYMIISNFKYDSFALKKNCGDT